MKKVMLVGILVLMLQFCSNALALNPGDIAIIGMWTDNPDTFAFVALVDIPASTGIIFTDGGWLSTGTFRTSAEGAWKYTAPSVLTAGTVIFYDTLNSAWTPYIGTIVTGGGSGFSLSTSGEQIIAFQGTDAAPTMIYAVNNDTTGGTAWQVTATNSNTSALPTGLVDGTSAVGMFPELDNVAYNGITSGTREQLLAAIGDPANWAGGDDSTHANRPVLLSGPFTVVTGIEGQTFGSISVFSLLPCTPNPSNRSTKFTFSLSLSGKVDLSVFNVLGQKVATVYSGQMAAGQHSISWNLKGQNGQQLPNGVYFYNLTDGSRSSTRRLLILK